MLTIDERIGEDGAGVTTTLDVACGHIRLAVGGILLGELPDGAIDIVMDRYGKPLAEGIVLDGPWLDLAEGKTLRLLRHRARYDVIARDFLVLERPGAETLAELATSVAAALTHLARAATARREEASRLLSSRESSRER